MHGMFLAPVMPTLLALPAVAASSSISPPASPPAAPQVQPPVVAFRVQVVEESDLQSLRFFEFRDARGQWEDFSYRKCIG